MGKFIVRRLLQMGLVLFGASLVLFACLYILPGDPLSTLGGGEKARDPATKALLEKRYNLDQPLAIQYTRYVTNVARGNLGVSFRLRRPVYEVIREKTLNTARLAFAAILFEIIIGIAAGVIAAVMQYSFWDVMVTLTTTLAIGFPTFVIGLIFQYRFALRWHLLPLSGNNHGLKSFILPGLTLASVDAALVARLMRGTMLEVMRADYIRTATAKGLSKSVVILKHAMRNSIIPVVTYLGISFGTLLGGALITEVIFNWNGIGATLVTAISTQDNPIVLGVSTYAVLIFVVVNLLVDITYGFLDPRIRLE